MPRALKMRQNDYFSTWHNYCPLEKPLIMENPFKQPHLLAHDTIGDDNDFIPLLTSEEDRKSTRLNSSH